MRFNQCYYKDLLYPSFQQRNDQLLLKFSEGDLYSTSLYSKGAHSLRNFPAINHVAFGKWNIHQYISLKVQTL